METSLSKGKLIKWKDERGFGFIQPIDGSQEVFLHISEIGDSTRRPQIGDTICYHPIIDQDKKVRASKAFILGARNKSTSLSASSNSKPVLPTTNKYPFPIFETLLLSILPLFGSINFVLSVYNPIPLILYPIMSLLTFWLYAEDKLRAKQERWRISEQTLHLCELLGGWLGGFVAQRTLRHKNIKGSYQFVFWTIVALHMAFWLTWLFLNAD